MCNVQRLQPLTQTQKVYRLLNGAIAPMWPAQMATILGIPGPSVRRELFKLRELQLLETTPIGVQLKK